MPSFQIVAERCNDLFSSTKIGQLRGSVELFSGTQAVGDIAYNLGLASEQQRDYLNQMPDAMAGALKGLVAANLRREQPFGMQFIWFEGAEWEFLISEVHPTSHPDSRGGISLMLRSPKL